MKSCCLLWTACLGLVSLHSGAIAGAAPSQAAPVQMASPGSGKPKILASLHAKNLEVTLGMVRDYLPVPFKPEALLTELFGDMGGQVALSAPVALVTGIDGAAAQKDDGPTPRWAFSVGVRSLDEAQKLAQSRGYLTGGRPGQTLLNLQTGSRGLFCLLSAGQGTSGRLSCSRQEPDRDLLGPYLAQEIPPSQTSDLHGEVRVDEIVKVYETPWQRLLQIVSLVAPQKLKLGEPEFDRALTDVMQALVGQFQAMSRDLQTLALDVSLDKSGIELRLAYRLIGQTSWWAQAEAAPVGTSAAQLFFNLPADSSAASFQSSDPKWAKKSVELLAPLLDGFLLHDGLPPADRKAINDVFTKVLAVNNSGPLNTVMSAAKSASPAASTGGLDPAALFADTNYLLASDGPVDWTVPWLKSVVAAYNRPGVLAYLRARWKKLDPTGVPPTLRADPLPKPLNGYGLVFSGNLAALSHSAGLSKATTKPRPLTLHVMCVPGNGLLWTAVGGDLALLVKRLGDVMHPPGKTLAQRGGLEGLREPGLRSGGFTSLVALSGYLDAVLLAASSTRSAIASPARSDRAVTSTQLFTMAPHHGEAPMTYLSRSGKPEPGGRASEVVLRVPQMVIEDIASLALQLALEK